MKTSCGMNARNYTIRNDGMSRLRPVVPEITFSAWEQESSRQRNGHTEGEHGRDFRGRSEALPCSATSTHSHFFLLPSYFLLFGGRRGDRGSKEIGRILE